MGVVRKLLMVFALVAAGALVGCGGGDQPAGKPGAPGLFVGEVAGTEFFLAVAITDKSMVAYICDGTSRAQWYTGSLPGGTTTLQAKNGERLNVSLSSVKATGSVTVAGAEHDFTLGSAERHPGGLYRHEVTIEGAQHVSGYVVLNDGRGKGMTLADGKPQKAAPLSIFSTARRPIITPF
jgi:hypothetical protein